MTNREFNEKRTGLANAFAAAGAELLDYMGVGAALAAIPGTEPQQYAVAGTLRMIGKMLPAEPAAEKPTGDLTDEQYQEILRPVLSRIGMARYLNGESITLNPSNYRAIINSAIAAHLARQAQAAKQVIDTPEFMHLLLEFYEQSSCEEFDKPAYDVARTAVIAHLAGQSQATKVQAVPKYRDEWRDAITECINIARHGRDHDAAAHWEQMLVEFDVWFDPTAQEGIVTSQEGSPQQAAKAETDEQAMPELTVWYGPMPESNGKSNFTAVLHRKDSEGFDLFTDGFQFARSEYPDRVRYEADFMRWLIGEHSERPELWDEGYDFDKHSGYVAPTTSIVSASGSAASEDAK